MSGLSTQRKKDISYKIVKEEGLENLSETTLYKIKVFKSAGLVVFKAFSAGISKYAVMDFEKAVSIYEVETGEKVYGEKILSSKVVRSNITQSFINAYKFSVIETILDYFGERYKDFNYEYVSLVDFSRYVLALDGVIFTEKDEDKKINSESIKQRKRVEQVKKGVILKDGVPFGIRLKETDMVKKDICYNYNLNDLMKVQNYYSDKKIK